MPRFKFYAIATVIALLILPSITPSQTQEPTTPPTKFVKHKKRAIANRYIVLLEDSVVPSDAPIEVRREKVTAIAKRHAETYGGKYDYIYETAVKGYAIELPNEAAAIAISKLPEVRFVEEDSMSEPLEGSAVIPQPAETACGGKSIPVTLLNFNNLVFTGPRRTSLLHGGITERSRLIIRNRNEFSQFWDQVTNSSSYKPPLPEVDFSREMILVAAMGERPSSGFEILIDGACEVNKQVEVSVRSLSFTCGMQLAVLTAPVDIVRMPRTELPVVFKETEVTQDCNDLSRP